MPNIGLLLRLGSGRSAGGRLLERDEKLAALRGAEESLPQADQPEILKVTDDLAE
jgi:hypothetical protein